jgi:hypothetical protein
MSRISSLNCCGISELRELSLEEDDFGKKMTPADKLWRACVMYYPASPHFRPSGSVIFTQASWQPIEEGYGFAFAEWLRGADLGEVIDTLPWFRNPNTNNQVKTWIWLIDRDKMNAWASEQAEVRKYVRPSPDAIMAGLNAAVNAYPVAPVVPEGPPPPAPPQQYVAAQVTMRRVLQELANEPTEQRSRYWRYQDNG